LHLQGHLSALVFWLVLFAMPSLLLPPPDFVGAGFQVGFGMAYGTSAALFFKHRLGIALCIAHVPGEVVYTSF
jgi:hypothetical protein